VTEPSEPGDLPPDLPPEYAEAYRRGYERASRRGPTDDPAVDVRMSAFDELFAPDDFDAADQSSAESEPTILAGAFREDLEPSGRPAWLVPALLVCMVAALFLGAYGFGRTFSDGIEDTAGDQPTGVAVAKDQQTGGRGEARATEPARGAWDGPVRVVRGYDVGVDCVLPPSHDAAGNRTSYGPPLMHDGDFSTAWRCAGDGRGVQIRISLGDEVRLAEVGLVPGYAKTDPRDGTDRYAQNNRITEVTWSFPGGKSVKQRLDGSADNRSIQTLRLVPVDTDYVTLEIQASTPGARNTVAISELHLAVSRS
jgi:hypothetical protein